MPAPAPTHPPSTIEVLVVDDHRTFSDAMCIAVDLQPGLRCRAAYRTAEDALSDIAENGCPDVVLLDVGLPGMDGVSATACVRAACPDARIIVLTADTSARTVIGAVEAGAHGFLPKSHSFAEVLRLVLGHEDDVVAEPLTLERALRYASETATGAPVPPTQVELTEREYEILVLLAEGLPVKRVAGQLHMSVHTCRGHVAALLRKFDVHSQLAAVVAAARMGLLPNLSADPQH